MTNHGETASHILQNGSPSEEYKSQKKTEEETMFIACAVPRLKLP